MEFPLRSAVDQEEREKDMSCTTSPTWTSSSSSPRHHWAPHSSSVAAPAAAAEREHMFEKVVTPSDVGKLNRLVIPKQHAERYFPLDPSSSADKGGLLLNFEEVPTGRPWQFRYSYWNSSQSYVMTKGWSRFVKDKRLDAGDTVSFSRSPSEDRLFIDWRHRPVLLPPDPPSAALLRSVVPTWASFHNQYHHHHALLLPPPPLYFRPVPPQLMVSADHGILDSVPVVAHGPRVVPRRQVRLFGVNLESSSQQHEEHPPPSPLQWRLSAAPAGRSSYSELQLMPMEEAKR